MTGPRARGVLVVGATGAWGRSILEAVVAHGDRAVGSEGPGAPSARATGRETAESPTALLPADVTREAEVERLFEIAEAQLPALDVVVWVADGVLAGPGLAETSLQDWERAVSATLRGAGQVCRLAVSEFLSAGAGGRLVLVAPSVSEGAPGQVGNAALASALATLGRSIAKEYGRRRIACNVILPRAGAPGTEAADLAQIVLYLASPEASYVNGECLRVDLESVEPHQ